MHCIHFGSCVFLGTALISLKVAKVNHYQEGIQGKSALFGSIKLWCCLFEINLATLSCHRLLLLLLFLKSTKKRPTSAKMKAKVK